MYKDNAVGEYFADLVAEGKVIIELKSVWQLGGEHCAQVINYLHIFGCRIGLLINLQGQNLEWKRLFI